jgi:hypothetical protein
MESTSKRLTGIAILAGVQIFVGCANLVVAVLPMTGIWLWGTRAAAWVAAHPWSHLVALAGELLVFAIYIWIGIGLWRLRPWARRAEIVFLIVVALSRLVDALTFRPVAVACAFLAWYALFYLWIIWYLMRPQARAAFESLAPVETARNKSSV